MPSLIALEEDARLGALRRLEILDTPRERAFDDITMIAAQVCGTPIAVINLVDGDRQWGKAMTGLADTDSPLCDSFCTRAIESDDEVFVVHDTLEDARFSRNPMVKDDRNIRFYAGAPIVDREGFKIGVVCVVDTRPRVLDAAQLATLAALARQAMAQMELRLQLQAEREHVRQTEELERLREQLVSTIAHELRTPLTSIRGWTEALLDEEGDLDTVQRDCIERVYRSARRLDRLVGDLAELARDDDEELSIRSEQLDLAALTRDAVAAMNARGLSSNLHVSVTAPPSLMLTGDGERLAQVVDNLCSNAVKYTPAGGCVGVTLEDRSGTAVLRVVDSGIGIPEEERNHLFERFFRASNAIDRNIPGTGIGLAVSRTIVESHGGSIDVAEGDDGSGTAFTVTLPVTRG